jgi:uncharacterized protein YacL (UPF0231 family)
MKNLEIRMTTANSKRNESKKGLTEVIVFLNHSEDKIKFNYSENRETEELQVYDNGEMIFCGSKRDLFEILKNANK